MSQTPSFSTVLTTKDTKNTKETRQHCDAKVDAALRTAGRLPMADAIRNSPFVILVFFVVKFPGCHNPLRKGLATRIEPWRFSSACYWLSGGEVTIDVIRTARPW